MAPASICPRHEAAGCQSSAGFAGPRTSGFRSRRARSRVPGSASSAAIHFVVIPAGADPVERIAGEAVDVFHMGRDYTASWLG